MNQILQNLFALRDGDGTLMSRVCDEINLELSLMTASSIPEDQLENLIEYLNSVLLHETIEPEIAQNLDRLYGELLDLIV